LLFFYDTSLLNIYIATVPNRMHHLDLGLFHYQIEFSQALLKDFCGQIAIDDFDIRLSQIPHFSGLKIFGSGLENIKCFTANEYWHIIKQILFVIDGLILKHVKWNVSTNKAKRLDQDLVEVYLLWNSMYLMSWKDKFCESDLIALKISFVNRFSTFI